VLLGAEQRLLPLARPGPRFVVPSLRSPLFRQAR
jgi:hypothetical protein